MASFREFVNALRRPFAGAPPSADCTLRWFGKLPSYSDYLVQSEQPAWAREFADWLIAGAARYHEEPHQPSGPMPSTCGVVRLPRSGVAVCFSHRDYGGDARGRSFGFCFFCGARDQALGAPSNAVSGNLGTLERLSAAHDELAQNSTAASDVTARFSSKIMKLDGITRSPVHQRLPDLSWEQWYEEVRPVVEAPSSQDWASQLTLLGQSIASSDGRNFEPHLRFPISGQRDWDAQAVGWAQWLERQLRDPVRAWSWFLQDKQDSGPGAWTVLGRAVLADDFLLLTPAATSVTYLDDAGKSISNAAPETMPPATWRDWFTA